MLLRALARPCDLCQQSATGVAIAAHEARCRLIDTEGIDSEGIDTLAILAATDGKRAIGKELRERVAFARFLVEGTPMRENFFGTRLATRLLTTALGLAVIVSIVAFAPAVHAAPSGQHPPTGVTPKDVPQCVLQRATGAGWTDSKGYTLTVILYVGYDTYSGGYCGIEQTEVDLWVPTYLPGGTLVAEVVRSNGTVLTEKVTTAAGGGPSGWNTQLKTNVISVPSGTCTYAWGASQADSLNLATDIVCV